MNIFLVTLPTLMWTLFPPVPRHRVNPQHFWRDTLQAVAPIAVLSGLAVAFSYWVMSFAYPDRTSEVATVTVLTATFFGVHLVFLVGKMLGVTLDVAARRARLLYLAAVSSVVLLSFGVATLRGFFDFTVPAVWMLWAAAPVLIVVIYAQRQLAERAGQKFENN